NIFIALLILSNVLLMNAKLLAGSIIEGKVVDGVTGEPLWGANIVLMGTSMGAATDEKGFYRINNVPAGEYIVRASYIGYEGPDLKITIKDGVRLEQNFKLSAVGLQGETVVVTAQAYGQAQAINQQLTSDKIVNVVSAAKIKELPDANAAESVGRLPGVSVLRSGGEGYGVVIRGLQPKYNAITVDGMQMASTSSSDRSSDLSMISSDMLNGIEVSKTITADMDAAVLGGVVNFELREAKTEIPGVPMFTLEAQGSYDGLINIENKFNNYKYVGSAENRFFDEKLGVFVQVGVERKNLSSNSMGATYENQGDSHVNYETSYLNLYKTHSDRQRYNGALVVDYKLTDGRLKFTNLFSTGKTNSLSRGQEAYITFNYADYTLSHWEGKQNILTNGISWDQHALGFEFETKLSHSYTESMSPNTWTADFLKSSANLEGLQGVANLDPKKVLPQLDQDLSDVVLYSFDTKEDFSKERLFNGSLDVKRDFRLSDLISAQLKFGGKYKYQNRSYDYTVYNGELNGGGESSFIQPFINNYYGLPNPTGLIYMRYFIDPEYDFGKMFDGDYKIVHALNSGKLGEMASLLKSNVNLFAANNNDGGFGYDPRNSRMDDYYGEEYHSAAYVMTTITIGQQITIIPGVRYQNIETKYRGNRGMMMSDKALYRNYDTTVTQVHGYWLPDVSFRYKPFEWCDIRLSYTNTLTYPDYYSLIPRMNFASLTCYYGNYELKPSRSTNYDAYISLYNNSIGLFTIGGFLKEIKDFVYSRRFVVTGEAAVKYLPVSLMTNPPTNKYTIWTSINHPYTIEDYGMEVDWQTHFWYLPGPLSGLVFNVNYTHIVK
ncbi:MAG TPA: TonB-dependent receptor, partial [Ignavibacteriales bacterium]|nr:TonB-dependent receptor [Ignavibacteriales bacterium]